MEGIYNIVFIFLVICIGLMAILVIFFRQFPSLISEPLIRAFQTQKKTKSKDELAKEAIGKKFVANYYGFLVPPEKIGSLQKKLITFRKKRPPLQSFLIQVLIYLLITYILIPELDLPIINHLALIGFTLLSVPQLFWRYKYQIDEMEIKQNSISAKAGDNQFEVASADFQVTLVNGLKKKRSTIYNQCKWNDIWLFYNPRIRRIYVTITGFQK
ncbi:MAG: hypothetical protein Q7S37_03015 [bacterium]|nr:hypothetical protein [bacterium]